MTRHIALSPSLIMIMIMIMSHVGSGQPMAKPGCPSRCGNVTVPYPFGVGSGCFLDKWFQIVCVNGTSPSLSGATDLTVTDISLDGTVRATRHDWVENNTEQSRQFQGSPFQLPELVYAPMVIKWQLVNYSTLDVFGTSMRTNETSRNSTQFYWSPEDNAYRAGPAFVNSSCEFYNRTSTRLECSCPQGYQGNPYLINGCQDIDECDLRRNGTGRCGHGSECLNVGGGFICSSVITERASRVKPILIGIGCGLGALLLLIGSWGLYKIIKRRKEIQQKEKFFRRNGGILLQQQLTNSDEVNVEKTKLFHAEELEKATENFNANRVLGQGGQGTVYKGMLVDGKIVAIKKSKILDEAKIAEFINEVVVLSQINHRNVVKLLGCCLETEVPLLVYEFIPNGTLSHYIHDPNEEDVPLITWHLRLRIAAEIAGALSYLHSSAAVPIYHRDVKSTNILLDEKYRAKVADFGTSRTISIEQTHLTTLVHGTFGYLDPEYFQSSQFTDKSDVYSFGVVLVELLSGQKPISMARAGQDRSLATYFMLCMEENRLSDIVDPRVAREGEKEAIVALATLARRCLDLSGKRRPSMKEVVAELERIQKLVQSSNGSRRDLEVVEYVRDEIPEPGPEPFDLFST